MHPNGPIIVGVDASDPSLEALRFGADLARRLSLELVAAHVRTHPGSLEPYSAGAFAEIEAETDASIDDVVAPILDAAGISGRVEHLDGEPAHELALLADRLSASMIALGCQSGRGEHLHRLLSGSTSRRLVGESRVPVLVVPVTASLA